MLMRVFMFVLVCSFHNLSSFHYNLLLLPNFPLRTTFLSIDAITFRTGTYSATQHSATTVILAAEHFALLWQLFPLKQFFFEDSVKVVPRLPFDPGHVSAVLEQDKSKAL